jgi:hypothetical protein
MLNKLAMISETNAGPSRIGIPKSAAANPRNVKKNMNAIRNSAEIMNCATFLIFAFSLSCGIGRAIFSRAALPLLILKL